MTPALLTALQGLHVPAEAVPDALDGWSGECEIECGVGVGWLPGAAYRGRIIRSLPPWTSGERPVRLPLTRPEVRQRIATVMGVGVRCPGCHGDGTDGRAAIAACLACHGTGYLRPPAPARHLLPASELGDLPDALAGESAGLLACHLAIVLNGGAGLRGVQSAWFPDSHLDDVWWRGRVGQGEPCNMLVGVDGWEVIRPGTNPIVIASGPETGPEGMAAADRAALLAGFALQSADGMLLPWPTLTQPETT